MLFRCDEATRCELCDYLCCSTLVNLFLYDVNLPRAATSRCPSRADFVARIFPQLQDLQATVLREVAAGISSATAASGPADSGNSVVGNTTASATVVGGESGDNEEAAAVSSLQQLRLSGGVETTDTRDNGLNNNKTSIGGSDNSGSEDSEQKKTLISLSKTRQSQIHSQLTSL